MERPGEFVFLQKRSNTLLKLISFPHTMNACMNVVGETKKSAGQWKSLKLAPEKGGFR